MKKGTVMIYIANTEGLLKIIIESSKKHNMKINLDELIITILNDSYHIFKYEGGVINLTANFISKNINERFRLNHMKQMEFKSDNKIVIRNSCRIPESLLKKMVLILDSEKENGQHVGSEPLFSKLYSKMHSYYMMQIN